MTEYRVVVAGEDWMGRQEFETEPSVGDTFSMASGQPLRITGILHDPVGTDSPEMLLQTERVA